MSESFSVWRIGIAISIVVHLVALIAGLGYAGFLLVPKGEAQSIVVDLVTPKEVADMMRPLTPDAPLATQKSSDQLSDAMPPPQKTQPKPSKAVARDARRAEATAMQKQAASSQPPVQTASQVQVAPQAQPAPQAQASYTPPDPDLSLRYPMMPTVFGGAPSDFDAKASNAARVDNADVAAFRAHLKKCSLLPTDVAFDDKVAIVIRAQFLQDGRLATAPILIEASASTKGPLLTQAAIAALQACQPFGTLPPAKYQEWKLLDLTFTPQDFRRG